MTVRPRVPSNGQGVSVRGVTSHVLAEGSIVLCYRRLSGRLDLGGGPFTRVSTSYGSHGDTGENCPSMDRTDRERIPISQMMAVAGGTSGWL